MCKCIKTGEPLPERNIFFSGYECRHKDRNYCKYFSYSFIDGTNCMQLRKPIDVKKILKIKEAAHG